MNISHLFSFLLLIVLLRPAAAQPVETAQLLLDARAQLTEAWHRLDRAATAEAGAACARAASDPAYAAFGHYYAGLALYRQVELVQDKNEQLRLVNEAVDHLEKARTHQGDFADALALLATVYGRKIMLQPASAFVLGPKLDAVMKRAMKLEPTNPRVVLLAAIGAYNRPKIWGGSKERGLEEMKRAAVLFAQDTAPESRDPLVPVWGREEVYAWIGLAQLEAGRLAEAEVALRQALDIAPAYGWVRHELLPRLADAQRVGKLGK